MTVGVHEVKSPHDSNRVTVHVIPMCLPDWIQYFCLDKVPFQHYEGVSLVMDSSWLNA